MHQCTQFAFESRSKAGESAPGPGQDLFDMKWHKKHPKACMCLWGIQDFEELLVLIECLFPDVDITKLPKLETKRKSKRRKKSPNMGLPVLSDIEVSMVVVVN